MDHDRGGMIRLWMHGPMPEMYGVEFNITTRWSTAGIMRFFHFFPNWDAVIMSEPLLSDSWRSPKQTAISCTLGKCADRVNPPGLPQWNYVKRCYRSVARTADGFTADSSLVMGAQGGRFEKAGPLGAQADGKRCTVRFDKAHPWTAITTWRSRSSAANRAI